MSHGSSNKDDMMNEILKSIDINPFNVETECYNFVTYTSREQLKRLLGDEDTKKTKVQSISN